MSNKTVTTKNEEATKKQISIAMDPIDFSANVKSKLITTWALGERIIGPLFRSVFSDYEGCLVKFEMGRLTAELYFNNARPEDENKYRAIQIIGGIDESGKGTMEQKIKRLNNMFKPNKYEMTEEAKELLVDFMSRAVVNPSSKTVNWQQQLTELTETVSYNTAAQHIYVKLSNIDIIQVLRTVYGTREDDSPVDYTINAIRQVGGNSTNPNMLINIARLNVNETSKIANEIGIQPSVNQIFMLR